MVARGRVIDRVRVLGTVTLSASETNKNEESGADDCGREREKSADNRSSVLVSLRLAARFASRKL